MELNKYLSPCEFQQLYETGKKFILKKVYEKVFTDPDLHMTVDGMTSHLFTFVVEVQNLEEGCATEKYYDCACPVSAVIGKKKR